MIKVRLPQIRMVSRTRMTIRLMAYRCLRVALRKRVVVTRLLLITSLKVLMFRQRSRDGRGLRSSLRIPLFLLRLFALTRKIIIMVIKLTLLVLLVLVRSQLMLDLSLLINRRMILIVRLRATIMSRFLKSRKTFALRQDGVRFTRLSILIGHVLLFLATGWIVAWRVKRRGMLLVKSCRQPVSLSWLRCSRSRKNGRSILLKLPRLAIVPILIPFVALSLVLILLRHLVGKLFVLIGR